VYGAYYDSYAYMHEVYKYGALIKPKSLRLVLRLNNNVSSFYLNIGKDHSPGGMGRSVVEDWQPRNFCHQT